MDDEEFVCEDTYVRTVGWKDGEALLFYKISKDKVLQIGICTL